MHLTRTDALAGLAGGVCAAVVAALDADVAGQGSSSIVTTIMLGALLGGASAYPRTTWAVAGAVLAATAQGVFALGDGFALYTLVAAHAFFAGRWDGRWRGVGGPVALIASGELNVAVAHGGAGPFLFLLPPAWGGAPRLPPRGQLFAPPAARGREL